MSRKLMSLAGAIVGTVLLGGLQCFSDDDPMVFGDAGATCDAQVEFVLTPSVSGESCNGTPTTISTGFDFHCIDEERADCHGNSFVECFGRSGWMSTPRDGLECADLIAVFDRDGTSYTVIAHMSRQVGGDGSTPLASGTYDATSEDGEEVGCVTVTDRYLGAGSGPACD